MKKISFLAFIFCVVRFCSFAQSTDTLIAGAILKKATKSRPESHQYNLYIELPDGKVRAVGLETRIRKDTNYNGKKVGLFIQKYQSERGVSLDSTFFEPTTLLPIAYRTDIGTEGYQESVDFFPDRITNKIVFKDSIKSFEKITSQGYYNAAMDDYLYSQLPLQLGYTVKFRHINAGKNYADLSVKITVIGSETLTLADGNTLECWILEEDNGFSKALLWYTKKNQEFIKRKFGTAARGIFWKTRLY